MSPQEPPPSTPSTPHLYETVLFDVDGVLAEVSQSYRTAILRTCHHYGATGVTHDTITAWKVKGNANNDWVLSYNLIRDDPHGRNDVTLAQVTETFEELYQGCDGGPPGLYTLETLIPDRATLTALRQRSRGGIGVVTGRPRRDCETFLRNHGLTDLIDVCYCADDGGPSKPDPYGVLSVCAQLGVPPGPRVVLIGDTPDDIRAAVAAGCRGVGVVTPEAYQAGSEQESPTETAPLAVAMRACGADMILPPGFADLVAYMAPPPSGADDTHAQDEAA